jgi:CHASE2 domain-containing sensor protein/two-component sensor histidine kinase
MTGSLQVLEWMAFDQGLQSRPVEAADAQIVIVGIDESDIKTAGAYPIPDQTLAKLLQTLQSYQPRAIGLDIFRDLSTGSSRAELAGVLSSSSNLIGIESSSLGSNSILTVKPPSELPPDRIGIANVVIDSDGKLRRSLLASKVEGKTRYSFALLLAQMSLRSEGVRLNHGNRASDPIQFGDVALPRFEANTGGYINAKAGGNQILLNFRAASKPFAIVSLTDVLTQKVSPDVMRDRIVLVGMTATSVNDTFMTSATKGTLLSNQLDPEQYQLIYGVEYQAHATSQILDAVLNHRPLIRTWLEGWEYVWILGWGMLGIALGLILQSPWKTMLSLAMSGFTLILICYGLILLGWWIPLVPALLSLSATGLTTSLFDRDSRVLLEQRSLTLKRTYDAVHNGPLQTLAAILRNLDETPLRSQLESVNQELRSVYELMKQELLSGENRYIATPMPELLYQIYEDTLQRNLPGFSSIEIYIPPNFDPLKDCALTPEQKQGLCIFLQEALCNVGRHGIAVNRLDVVCTYKQNEWCLQIIDDGIVESVHPHSGQGTDQARELARSLNGRFERRSRSPQGMVCELAWQNQTSWRQRLSQKL